MTPWLLEGSEVVSQGFVLKNAPPTWVIILVIVPAIVAFTVMMYRLGREGSSKIRLLLTALRTLALLLVALLLMDPAIETLVVERKPTLTVVLADTSASMAHRDDYSTSPALAGRVRAAANIPAATPLEAYSRLDLMKRVLDDPADSYLEKLGKEKKLRLYAFGERVAGIPGLRDLEATERFTALGRALERVLDEPEVKSTPVGGIVLLSDGKNTLEPAPLDIIELAARRKIPVHTVAVGDPQALKDIELVSVLAPGVALVEDRVSIELKIRQRGYAGERVEIRLLENDIPLARQQETLLPTEDDQLIRLFHKPVRPGQAQWVVEVKPLPGEHTVDNNRQTIDITIKTDKLKVLYVESWPRWEYRTLMQFLTRGEEAFETQCFLVEADRGFPQETTAGMTPLIDLPDTEEAIGFYDVILFGDVDPDALGNNDPERARRFMALVRKFVEDGGGLGVIAGVRFTPRAYKDTPLGEVLPILVDPTEIATEGDGGERGFKLKLTEVGKVHPILQLADEIERNVPIWETHDDPLSLKENYWFYRVKRAKPGALVLAVHENERNANGLYPLMVAGNYGAGPVFFTALDETWRWYGRGGAFTHHRFWGNVVRHLARTRLYSGDRRFRLFANRTLYQRGERITLTAYVKDKSFRPSDAPEQEVALRGPDGTEKREKLPRVEPGKFERSWVAGDTGQYGAWIPSEDGLNDEKLSPVQWRVVDSDLESKEPILDEPTLRAIASRTGGRFVDLSEAKELLASVADGTVEVPRQRRTTSLRSPTNDLLRWLPLAFVALLAIEWILRKRHRML